LRGLLVVFHRDLTIAKNETIPESGGINELLEYIKGDPGKRTADLARGINNSTRTTERWIKLLRESGKIEFRGSKKTGGYYINQVET
jgi:ATP-dependent DNA helicase RecG